MLPPATPDNPQPIVPRLAIPNTEGMSRQGPAIEPSPASTYFETEPGESAPTTPANAEDSAALTRDIQKLHIHETSQRSPCSTDESFFPSHESGIGRRMADSDSTLGSMHVPKSAGHLSSPSSPRHSPFQARAWQNHAVRFATSSNENDPFVSTEEGGYRSRDLPERFLPESHPAKGNLDRSDEQLTKEERSRTFQPREDRELGEISGDNAQAVLSPSACVFVANLAATSTDDQLEHEVSRVFEQFGKVYAKIKRDSRGMPYAFCQYENQKDAENAITMGHGLPIQGRACRTERARVNRSLYLSRTSGGTISESHARMILAGYGPLEKLWISGLTDREMFRLPEGIWITFAFFQDCRDAQAAFKDNPDYRLEQPALPDDIRQRADRTKVSPFARSSPLRGRLSSPLATCAHRHASNSVFVGNVPPNVSLSGLRDHFSTCGAIKTIEIIAKANVHSSGTSVFAFIEFATEVEARKAVTLDAMFESRRLRVELRESHDHIYSRSAAHASAGSPRNRGPSGAGPVRASQGLEAAMTRALALGIPAATTFQIFDTTGLENGDSLSHTSLASSLYPSLQYFGSPYSQYGTYTGNTGPTDTSPAGISVYSPIHTAPSAISQYPYGSIMNAQYSTPYHVSPYLYSSLTGENNGNTASAGPLGPTHGDQSHT